MGSGGMSSRLSRGTTPIGGGTTVIPQAQPQVQVQQQQQNIQNQTPNAQNTPVNNQALQQLTQMDDSQLAAFARYAKTIQLPNNLDDIPDENQRFAFAAGLNEKPIVLDDASFAQYMKDNGMTADDLLSRNVDPVRFTSARGTTFNYSADEVIEMMKYSRLNYVGGKKGGQSYGAGTYFDHKGGQSTTYGGMNARTAVAVLNPATTKAITLHSLMSKAQSFASSHPQFARVVGSPRQSYSGGNISIYAMAMGYNVILESNGGRSGYGNRGDYVNVIDRSALIYRESNN